MRSGVWHLLHKLDGCLPPGRYRPWAWATALSVAAHALTLSSWPGQSAVVQQRTPAIKLGQPIHPANPSPSTIPTMPGLAPAKAPRPAPANRPTPDRSPAPTDQGSPPLVEAIAHGVDNAGTQVERTEPQAQGPVLPPPALAPGIEWRYLLLQNGHQGQARLSWRPDGAVYTLRMERELGGRTLPGSRSEGRLDSQGLKPLRFTQQRPARPGLAPRDAAATNFRQGEGQDQISFSASAEQVPMPAGVQDRISWWLQLAGMIAAAPQQFLPGQELRLMVVGLRGEAREWRFEILPGTELDLPAGHVKSAVHLRRIATGPYDGDIELWLDPARHHLPVRLMFSAPEGRGWELQLQDEGLPQP